MAAEVKAIHDGVKAGSKWYQGQFRILSDSLEAIHVVCGTATYKGVEELVIEMAKREVETASASGICYCKREANSLAHMLAKDALGSPQPLEWLGDDVPRRYTSIARAH